VAGFTPATAPQFLNTWLRCQVRKCGCGRSLARTGGSARRDLLTSPHTPSASLTCRDTRMSRSSERPISPRSNIQWTVPDSASPFPIVSGPFASTGRICAASTSARRFSAHPEERLSLSKARLEGR